MKVLGTVIVMLVVSRTLRRPLHGLLLGAFVGLGFQVGENVLYAATNAISNPDSDLTGALVITLLRLGVDLSSHWLYAGISGVGAAYLLGRTVSRCSPVRRLAFAVGLFALAWALHFQWNSPAKDSNCPSWRGSSCSACCAS